MEKAEKREPEAKEELDKFGLSVLQLCPDEQDGKHFSCLETTSYLCYCDNMMSMMSPPKIIIWWTHTHCKDFLMKIQFEPV